eukprot:jgi/Phyca11/121356/e_gw1.44.317.1
MTVTVGFDRVGPRPQIDSHGSLVRLLGLAFGPTARLTSVHPHPAVGRFICLWTNTPLWTTTRRDLREALLTSQWRKGRCSLHRRNRKWRTASSTAAKGLERLEWNSIRRIAGIGPWGEQILLRLKLHAFSLYDQTVGCIGCWMPTC